ncbi:MAG: tRNA (adenosine(37)-N6)-dimethylallyltransferase MiaA [Lachnospiraceae bacterium]|nr:tRNA (adenosine(37)-N6)-dimethylallyltransferase MiaA [Lachnospiraceae bacterium]
MMKLIILSGPTAVGKTELSLKLAKAVNGEIISADSMQVYRQMDIGTAKILPGQMQGVKHHLIDICDPSEEWNVFRFKEEAKKAIIDINSRGCIPIITGGTGFYIQAVLYDIDFEEEGDKSVRERLERELAEKGPEVLYNRLMEVDPASTEIIHMNNSKRVIRALEFYELNGYPISKHNAEQRNSESPYNFAYFVLNDDRARLYERIDRRVNIMLKDGLVDEVKALMDEGYDLSYVSMQGLGYKEIYRYLTGEISLEEAVYILKRDTRHFAKRQLTWFRREKELEILNRPDYGSDDEILAHILEITKSKGIIN